MCYPAIVDIGSAWFKYDMRRLSEILAFPRAWYRRTIVRRMFLGDPGLQPDAGHAHAARASTTTASASAAPHSPLMPQREKNKTTDHQKPKGKLFLPIEYT